MRTTTTLLRALGVTAIALLGAALTTGGAAPAGGAAGHGGHHGPAAASSDGCGATPAIAPGTSETVTIVSGGIERAAIVHVPEAYAADVATPLVLGFHGRGSTGALLQEFSGLSALPAITVFPEGVAADDRQSWQGAPYAAEGVDDVAFTSDLLDTLEAGYCVDTHRVFATGKSNGGGLVALLACTMPDRIAAFAPVAGAYYPGTAEGCETAGPAAVLEIHGTSDATMLYDGGTSHDTDYPSVPAWLDVWAERDGCHASTSSALTDDTTVTRWRGCEPGAALVHVAVTGGGHTWPGELAYSGGGYATQSFSATWLMWDFFMAHPLRG